jgi:succinate dehydrogenase / fumarate reductase, cytochrome b subunit
MTPQKAFASSIGSKFLIALTGLFLLLFLVAHLAGNLLFIAGPDQFNHYGHALISNPLILIAEAGLVAIFLLHVVKTVAMVVANRGARPDRYAASKWAKTKNDRSRKTLSSTTMILTGSITLLFVVTHLVTFKFGPYYETAEGIRDLYRLQLAVFSSPGYVAFYLVCMSVIGFHLWHGISSAAQSFGLDSPVWTPRIIWTGRLLTAVITAGFALLPVFTFALGRN